MVGSFRVVNDRHGVTKAGNEFLDHGKREAIVVVKVKLAAPGIEQLDGDGAGSDLGFEIENRRLSNAMKQIAEGLRFVVEKTLGGGETFLGFAFHHVTRESPRSGGKT